MENTSTKVDVIKPFFLKAGIPLAITAVGFLFARITRRKGSNLKASSAENHLNIHGKYRGEDCFHDLESVDSSSLCCLEADHPSIETSQQNSEKELQHQHIHELEEEILALRSQIKDVHVRELELETQYLYYHDIKGQELVLMELENMLLLEITRVELLDREISSVEEERQRFENMPVECQKILALLQVARSRNRMLKKRVKKLLRKTKEQRKNMKEHYKQIEAKEAEISRTYAELEAKANIIRNLEDQIQEQQTALWWLQVEKNDLSKQIELAHKEASSKIDIEKADREDYSRVVSKLEKVENERVMEIKELIYLRWCNACLRHELMRKNQEEQDSKQYKNQTGLKFGEIANVGSNNELGHSTLENGDSCLNFPTTSRGRAHSKRKKFIEKLKRWVEGNEKTKQELNEKDNHETKHFGPDELHVHARKSCSSA